MKKLGRLRIKNLSILLSSSFLLFPAISYAFPGNLTGFVCLLLSTFNLIIPILNALALLLFFWGVAKFILSAGNDKELAAGKQFMIWGVVAIFILVSFWGIMQFLADQFGFGTAEFQFLPTNGQSTSCGSIESTDEIIHYDLPEQ